MSSSQPDMGSQITQFKIATETKLPLINSVGLVWKFFKSILLHLNFLSFSLSPYEFTETAASLLFFPLNIFYLHYSYHFLVFNHSIKPAISILFSFFLFLTYIHQSKHFIAVFEALYFLRCTMLYAECNIHLSNVMKIILVLFSASKYIPNVNII